MANITSLPDDLIQKKKTSLPDELLNNVLSQIDKISQIAECRLVCKAWSSLAEQVMLGYYSITIRSEKGILRLYTLLIKHPAKAKLIRHLNFDIDELSISPVLEELVHLVFTPNVESITGLMLDEDFFTLLKSIIDKSPVKFKGMKTITISPIMSNDYLQFLLHFTDSLETLKLDVGECPEEIDWEFFKNMGKFKALTCVALEGLYDTIEHIHSVLNNCPHVKILTIHTHGWDATGDIDDMLVWNESVVNKQHNLNMLTIKSQCPADLLEYLLYQYTNIETIVLDIDMFGEDYLENNIGRITMAIKNISHKVLFLTVPSRTDFRKAVIYLKNNNYAVSIHSIKDQKEVCIKVEGI